MSFLDNKKILITGGSGFLGKNLISKIKEKNIKDIFYPRRNDYNLLNIDEIKKLFFDLKPDVVIHLAAVVGGIGANSLHPAKFFYENAIMGIQLFHESYINKIEKFVSIGTICSYPSNTAVPFKEKDLWNGYPEATNAPYGIAKKILSVQSSTYRQEYNFNSIYLMPVNMYGPYDNFDEKTSHVIPAIIKKIVEAKQNNINEVTLWGNGSPTREFIYVEDVADAIILATEKLNESDPINIGTGENISIKDLARMISTILKFNGKIKWDVSKPNGQEQRKLDTSLALNKFGFKYNTNLSDGLNKTIKWYEENYLKL
tara:strand:- start:25 stop:969 length:945 start_codon:yes stop_codon:yes gene_type:complete